MYRFESTLVQQDSAVYPFVAFIPPDILEKLNKQGIKRVLCSINHAPPYSTAPFPGGEGQYFLTINKTLRDKFRMLPGSNLMIELSEDTSDYGMPMPDEMAILLQEDEIANQHFHALTPGKQRSLLYIINKFKSSDKRIEKALVITEHLKANQGVLDFKMLNVAFKEYNNL